MKFVKILSCLMCFCLLAVSLTGCGGDKAPVASSEAVTTAAPAADVTVIADKVCSYTLIRPEESPDGEAYTGLAVNLQKILNSRYHCIINSKSDLIAFNTVPDDSKYEILIGPTNRPQSQQVREELENLEMAAFAIKMDGHKLVITGTDAYSTWEAIGYLLENCLSDQGLILPENYYYQALAHELPSPEQVIESGCPFAFVTMEKMTKVSSVDDATIMQGGGTDGRYAYYGLINKDETYGVIAKYDLNTWELVATSGHLNTGHTNDITYDSVRGQLAIPYCGGDYRTVTYIDPDTLTIKGTVKADSPHRAIQYLPATNQYLLASTTYFYIADANMKTLKSIPIGDQSYTTQGLWADEHYIYDVRFKDNYVVVQSLTGKYVDTVMLYSVTDEPENMFRIGDDFFLGCNGSKSVWRVKVMPIGWNIK